MKKSALLIAAIFCMATSFATTHTISVGGMSFTPATLTVHPGDVINWVWADGTHTTTSTSVPTGAATWNSNINSSTTSFSYTPTVIGTYQYQCSFHAAMGMVGTITVVSAANVSTVNNTMGFNMYPNPAKSVLHLQLPDNKLPVTITMTDLRGVIVLHKVYSNVAEAEVNLDGLNSGLYIVNAVQGNKVGQQQLSVFH